jgi:uncharacterized protein HemX
MSEAPTPPSAPHAAEPQGHGMAYAMVAVFVLALAFGAWGLWRVFEPVDGDPRAQLREQRTRVAELE